MPQTYQRSYDAAMGRLREVASQREIVLLANHQVGRDSRCDLVITDARVSMTHASVRWDGVNWCLRDMGSTNRTFVNHNPIGRGEVRTLQEGDRIDFGTAALWELIDRSQPSPSARDIDSGEHLVSADEHVLAISESLVLYRGEDGCWHTHDGRKQDSFSDGDFVADGETHYRLSLPVLVAPTAPGGGFVGRLVSDVHLRLDVAPGEDRVEATLSCDGSEVPLGRHGHNRILLALARARIQDEAEALPFSLAGWRDVHEISNQTYRDLPRLNTEVYRIRKKLAPLRLANFADIIERDEDLIRLGTAHLSIVES